MKNALIAFVVGLVFSIGLSVAGMTQPQKIIGFLDVFGNWDPSLMFVMMGAIGVHFFAYKYIAQKNKPTFDENWHIPNRKDITPALIIGSILFGFGWGLGGFCPGPAITSLASFEIKPILFFVSMLSGMVLFRLFRKVFKL